MSQLKARYYRSEDYETLVAWWRGFDCAPPPPALLPPSAVMVERDGKPLAYSHVWLANAKVAIIGLTICDPALPGMLRHKATMAALEAVIKIGKAHAGPDGCLWSCTDNPGLVKMYERLGFKNAGAADTFHMALGQFDTEFLE